MTYHVIHTCSIFFFRDSIRKIGNENDCPSLQVSLDDSICDEDLYEEEMQERIEAERTAWEARREQRASNRGADPSNEQHAYDSCEDGSFNDDEAPCGSHKAAFAGVLGQLTRLTCLTLSMRSDSSMPTNAWTEVGNALKGMSQLRHFKGVVDTIGHRDQTTWQKVWVQGGRREMAASACEAAVPLCELIAIKHGVER